MFATLVPIFNDKMEVSAYSVFAQKQNYFLNPELLGVAIHDGAARIAGLEVIQNMGIETWADNLQFFVELNNISVFADIEAQCDAPHERLVLLIDTEIPAKKEYVVRLKELKEKGYKLAIRKLSARQFEEYREILNLMDYILLNCKRVDMEKAKLYFSKVYPDIKLCAGNIDTTEMFRKLRDKGGCALFEGPFFRLPVTEGDNEVAPLKVNYIQLLNVVNSENFELTEAADIIGRDTALIISLLSMVNRMAINSEVTSIRHAAAMLGQDELKKWINTAVVNKLYADKPNEITRFSLLRAKFAENLAPVFGMGGDSAELFLMGLFSVLDVILDKSMKEALDIITVSKDVRDALLEQKGKLAPVLDFIMQYESANWQEVSRQMILLKMDMKQVYEAYTQSLIWYRHLMMGDEWKANQ